MDTITDITSSAKALMARRQWSQARLAEAVGIHPVTLCRLLAEPKKPETAYDKLKDFLSQDDSPTSPPGDDAA